MKFLDKAKLAADQVAAKAKEGVEDVQTKRELTATYVDLGKTTFDLVDKGELDRPELKDLVDKIHELKAKLEDAGVAEEEQTDKPENPTPAMPV